MKLPILSSLVALVSMGVSQAGSFGGPGPFSNLSPLQSGIDGSYQATARGDNLTGIIRFAYQGGVQTQLPGANTYVFFVNGNVVTGGTTASITGKDLAGVLGGQDFVVPTNDQGSTELPLVFIVRGNRANGFFEGSLDLEDRLSSFGGDGEITSAASETNTVIFIPDSQGGLTSIIQTNQFVIPSGSLDPDPNVVPNPFTFQGVRNSVIAQGAGGGTSSSSTSTTGNN